MLIKRSFLGLYLAVLLTLLTCCSGSKFHQLTDRNCQVTFYSLSPVGTVLHISAMYRFISKALGFTGYVIQYACITHCTFEYVGDFVVCSGPSMEPTLYTNNVLITERISAKVHKVQRGDIVIARCPTDPKNLICKRVIGLPGDRIIVNPISNQLKANGLSSKAFSKALVSERSELDSWQQHAKKQENSSLSDTLIVPRGHIWIEGDNAANSADSRFYGPVPLGLVNSRALCRIWPVTEIKLLI